jgi:peptidoglycan hydrolase-like protein with peptidoglycan-binding domain
MTDYPTYSGRATMDKIVSWKSFKGMHPKMQERVRGLIEASGGKVGLGQGLRPETQQLQLFLSRHVPDPNGKYSYDGKRWTRKPGVAAAAPPGRSMHEIGLAADLTGDMGFIRDNCARFNLQTFEKVNSEPWHVQPVELKRGRRSYENDPTWGRPPWNGSSSGTTSSSFSSSTTTAAPSSLTPAYRVKPGDTGAAVEVLIEALIAGDRLADAKSSRIGGYTPERRDIVESFQREKSLDVDGIVGPQTWSALLRVVKPGDEGAHPRVLQVTLITRGLMADTIANRDGKYGAGTQRIVKQFQKAAGLGADGEAGPKTWTALMGEKKAISVSPSTRTRGAPTRGAPQEVDADEFDPDDMDILAVFDGMPIE